MFPEKELKLSQGEGGAGGTNEPGRWMGFAVVRRYVALAVSCGSMVANASLARAPILFPPRAHAAGAEIIASRANSRLSCVTDMSRIARTLKFRNDA